MGYLVIRNVVVQFVGRECELHHFAKSYNKYMYIAYLLGFIILTCFWKYVKLESGKSSCF